MYSKYLSTDKSKYDLHLISANNISKTQPLILVAGNQAYMSYILFSSVSFGFVFMVRLRERFKITLKKEICFHSFYNKYKFK